MRSRTRARVRISERSPNSVVFSHYANDLEIGHFLESGEHRRTLRIVDLLSAGVVAAALHIADLERPREVLLQERDVLEKELFLQGLGAGGDDDAFPRHQRGNQVRERLAGAGAGLDDQVPPIGDGAFDAFRHLHLPGPELIGRVPFRESATLPENFRAPEERTEVDMDFTILPVQKLFPRKGAKTQRKFKIKGHQDLGF